MDALFVVLSDRAFDAESLLRLAAVFCAEERRLLYDQSNFDD